MTTRLGCLLAAVALLSASCITVNNTIVQPAGNACHAESDDTGLFSFGCLYDCTPDDCDNHGWICCDGVCQ